MPRICPHCRFPFDPDWGDENPVSRAGQVLPAPCPRCGGQVSEPATGAAPASIAAFLHKPAVEPVAETTAIRAETTASGTAPGEAPPATDLPTAHSSPAPVAEPAIPEPEPEAPAAAIAEPPTVIESPTPVAPSFARRSVEPALSPRTVRWQWIVLALLLLALPLQLLLADRARLAADADWRPLLLSLCGAVRCELPPWREPQALTMIERDVQPVAGAPGVLQVRATFRNDARWAQAWPRLQLSLADADGRPLGARGFEPREYLGRAPTALLGSGQSAQVAFRIRETATPAASFQFEFR